ncbi:MAG: type secretion system protein PorQ [Bacteroidota bacterium]
MRKVYPNCKKLGFFIAFIFTLFMQRAQVAAQTTAGNAVYNFLQLPYSAKATALGGINISTKSDLGLAMFNPALLESNMDGDLHVSVKPYYASIKQYDFSGANYFKQKNIVLGWGVHYMDYGSIQMRDVIGNDMGLIKPNDYAVQVSLSTSYIQNFQLGTSLKLIQSNYGAYKSNGVAFDIGLVYSAPSDLSNASILIKNIGLQTKSYLQKEELPFNVIIGWTKKLENAPVQFSVTAERMSVWNNLYYDSTFSNMEGVKRPSSLKNVFNHLVIGGAFFIGEQVELNLGYNFIRRFELNVDNQQNFMNGFSAGFGLALNRTKLQYGNAFFQKNLYHHITLFYSLKK